MQQRAPRVGANNRFSFPFFSFFVSPRIGLGFRFFAFALLFSLAFCGGFAGFIDQGLDKGGGGEGREGRETEIPLLTGVFSFLFFAVIR